MNNCWQMTVKKLGTYQPKKQELDTRDEESEGTSEIGGRRFGKGTHYQLVSSSSRSMCGIFRRESIQLMVNKTPLIEIQRNGHLLAFRFLWDAWDTQDRAVQWQNDKGSAAQVDPVPPKWSPASASVRGKKRYKEPHGIESSNVRVHVWLPDGGTGDMCLYRVQVSPTQRGKR